MILDLHLVESSQSRKFTQKYKRVEVEQHLFLVGSKDE
jgi:hypothetical protein